MIESLTESEPATSWSVAECPFAIEYSAQALDDIRLAVVDAFFSLPRGGAEIGGILLGRYENGRLWISDYLALDCEHAFGPSFTLSPRDMGGLEDLLASAGRNGADRRPVGWYHSHTRSEIFLSDVDQDIHRRYFPEPWQVALVLKPHTFNPTRCGFFFREADGSIHGGASYQEFDLKPLPITLVPVGGAPAPVNHTPQRRGPEPQGPVITVAAQPVAEPAPEPPPSAAVVSPAPAPPEPPPAAVSPAPAPPEPPPTAAPEPAAPTAPEPPQAFRLPPAEVAPPQFLQVQPARSWHWLGIPVAVTLGLAIGGAAFQTRDHWLPRIKNGMRSVLPQPAPLHIGLNTIDILGQLQIRWDRESLAVRKGVQGILQISDGSHTPRQIRLDPPHLQAGIVTFSRETEKVDLVMRIDQPDGRQVREATSFIGKLPVPKPPAEDSEMRRQRDESAAQAAKLRADLNAQAARARKLEKKVEDLQTEMIRRRLGNQNAAPAK